MKPADQRIVDALVARVAAMPSMEDPLWRGMVFLLEQSARDTTESSCRPGLSADERSFNDGRVSMAADIQAQLEDLWQKAHPADS